LFSFEAAQQALLAQQPGLHAFSPGGFETTHDRAESDVAATGSVIASKIDTANLLNTAYTF